jgi:hypothetical protein
MKRLFFGNLAQMWYFYANISKKDGHDHSLNPSLATWIAHYTIHEEEEDNWTA